jgi:DNA replication and repair protein RecF
MQLIKLQLINFKNYTDSVFDFSKRINIFVGDNGAGKTNILDAIYYNSFCKSYFNPIDSQNIRHGEAFFSIKGVYKTEGESKDEILVAVKKNERKRVKLNAKEYSRLADHIGLFPLVMISPMDSNMIYGGSDERRKYIDGVISQFDHQYLDTLLNYNKVLQHRNALLKALNLNRGMDASTIEIWNDKMCFLGAQIHEKRQQFLQEFIPLIRRYYEFISDEREEVGINYRSQLNEGDCAALLQENFQKDLALKHTSSGVHRDDLVFTINGFPLRKYGSQGQQKSFLLALKIAQFEYMKDKKGFKPLLLLDDVFDKLDYKRVAQLMKLVSRNEFGQIFVTDTNKERVERIFKEIEVDLSIFEIKEGAIYEQK